MTHEVLNQAAITKAMSTSFRNTDVLKFEKLDPNISPTRVRIAMATEFANNKGKLSINWLILVHPEMKSISTLPRSRLSFDNELFSLDIDFDVFATHFMKHKPSTSRKFYVQRYMQREAILMSLKCYDVSKHLVVIPSKILFWSFKRIILSCTIKTLLWNHKGWW